MDHNPYTAQCATLQNALAAAEARKLKTEQRLQWHRAFDLDGKVREMSATEHRLKSLRQELDSIMPAVRAEVHLDKFLAPHAALGLDPRRWFAADRRGKAAELDACRSRQRKLNVQTAQFEEQMESATALLTRQRTEIDRYRTLDPLEEQVALKAVEAEIATIQPEFDRVHKLRDDLDRALESPRREMAQQCEQARALQRDIGGARDLEDRLTRAENSYERAMVHKDCEARFGESKPHRVVERKQRELAAVKRTISKLEDRLGTIRERATREVKTVIVDGNNLCYEDRAFIGLHALRALAAKLDEAYQVVIVFDASARRLFQMGSDEIAAQFGDAAHVHVVATKQKADETLLDAAAGAGVYVISNDRFREFPEKPAVRQKRLLRHEILNGMVCVHDLDIAVQFA